MTDTGVMTMPAWTQWVSVGADLAAIVGLLGVILAYLQLRAGLQGQREATALGIWKDYLSLAMENPKLAVPSTYMTGAGKGTPDYERYEGFVSIMLFACEQIVALRPNDRVWTATVVDQLRYHVAYLGDKQFGAVHYSRALRDLFYEALQKGPPKAAV